ncbi:MULTISPECIES: GntR family transcriptional regulator [Bacillus]|uniref:GntR family transcriptional regulator n=1 Tax=Bacillus TaxID=1386 RepID=UPI0002EB7738|nr:MULTISPECIES: GntR family transcriptional regulator [Bacillus]
MIDKKSPVPIYHQLEELIKQQIDSGQLQPNQAIPSEREFTEQYQISRMTVRQALTNLVNDGLLYRKKGTGTFVSERKVERVMQGLTSFSEDMIERGLTPSSEILSYEVVPASPSVSQKLEIDVEKPVLQIERIRLADDVPMAIETAYMPLHLIEGLTKELAKDSIYQFIEEKFSLKIDVADQELEAVAASDYDAKHLHIKKGSPVLKIIQVTYLEDRTPIEYVKSSFRADRYRFYNQLKRQ